MPAVRLSRAWYTEPALASVSLQMLATIVVLRTGKLLGVISFPDLDLSTPRKVRL